MKHLPLASATMIYVAGLGVPAFGQEAGDIAYGSYLAAQCASCHGAEGALPLLDTLSVETLADLLEAYRSGERNNAIMQNVAQSLGPREIAALKAHLAQTETGSE